VIEVLRAGSLTTVQDLGRPGLAHIGVPPSGAADPPSLALANRLVGNPDGAPALEATLQGPALRFHRPASVALAGAPCRASAAGRPVGPHAVLHLAAGAVLDVGSVLAGVRTYVAVRGGLAVAPVLGSASTDLLTGLGPAPVRTGDRLAVGQAATGWPLVDVAPVPPLPERPELRVLPGPRDDWFAPEALEALMGAWRVQPTSNRIGVRLAGPALPRVRHDELPSEGVVAGAIQVPPSGEPIILLADHPTTGGYPVIAVVAFDDLPAVGQLRPGVEVRLRRAPSPPPGRP
jgi:biotin-dependent carboxylase-like uncharacterized protein